MGIFLETPGTFFNVMEFQHLWTTFWWITWTFMSVFLFQVSVWSQLVLLYDELFSFGFGYDYRQTRHFVLHEYLLTPRFFLEHLRGLYLDDST
jgi:hypothetical protein